MLLRVVNEGPADLLWPGSGRPRGVAPLTAVRLLRCPEVLACDWLGLELRTTRLSLAEAFDLHDALARLRVNGVNVSAHTSRLDLAHLLAISAAATHSCPPLSGPMRAELTLGHLDLSGPLMALGLRVNTAVSGSEKSHAVLVNRDDTSTASERSEARWLEVTLDFVLRAIGDRVGHELRPGEIVSTGAEAFSRGLVSRLGDSIAERRGERVSPSWLADREIAVRHIRPSRLARDGRLAFALRDLVACARDASVAAIVLVLEVGGMATALADRWWSTVRALACTKPVVSYARVATSGGMLPLVAGTRAIASPLARVGSTGAIAYEVDRASIPLWRTVRAPARGTPATVALQRRADVAAGLLNTRIAQARGLEEAQRALVGQGALMTAEQARGCGLIDQVGSLSAALDAAAELAHAAR